MADWSVERVRGGAGALHARGVPALLDLPRRVELFEPDRAALVLGSTQRDDVADLEACAAAGVEVVRRRSGGGAVLVDPPWVLWADLVIGVGDSLWVDDVGRSAVWLGEAWAGALHAVGFGDATVHRGSMCLNRWGRLVCFAGLGPGEVTRGVGGPKTVGISQRRTRDGARFQCAVPLAWDAGRITSLLRFDDDAARTAAAAELSSGVVAPVDESLAPGLLEAFLDLLPT